MRGDRPPMRSKEARRNLGWRKLADYDGAKPLKSEVIQPELSKDDLYKQLREMADLIETVPPYRHWDKGTRDGVVAQWKEQIDEFLENPQKTYVFENYRALTPEYSTGSNSGSLIGFCALRGLAPVGQIIREHPDQVPFSGELFLGASEKGVNQGSVSFCKKTATAISYAEQPVFNTKGWTPELSKERVVSINEEIARMESVSAQSRDAHTGRDLFQEKMEALKTNLAIEERRQRHWIHLGETERSFVTQPFPIVYGILKTPDIDEESFEEMHSDIRGEYKHNGKLPIDDTKSGQYVLYCPEDKINLVKQYLEQNNVSLPVHPLTAVKAAETVDGFNGLLNVMRKKKSP